MIISRKCHRSTCGGSKLVSGFVSLMFMMSQARASSAGTLDGLIVVSRHGVRRQFPSSAHDFAKYAPGKEFETTDEVRTRTLPRLEANVWGL